MENTKIPQLVIGDFNFCYLEKTTNPTRSFLEALNYKQLIREPTHIEGHLLDQAYLRDDDNKLETNVETHSKYFTDHKALSITVKKGKIIKKIIFCD